MAIFKLKMNSNELADAELIEATRTELELEKYLEDWLERSPWAIAQEPLLCIGRQTFATSEGSALFPDLIGIDKDGSLVIIELKKGRTPREAVAQILEYAAWASELSDVDIRELANQYWTNQSKFQDRTIDDIFRETFELDDVPLFNTRLRLFIAAEEISSSVSRVCRFLRQCYGVDVQCIAFKVYKTESGEILVNSETIVGQEEITARETSTGLRWSGDKPVKQVVWEAVQTFTQENQNQIFAPKDIIQIVLSKYPNFNKSTINCQIIADCVNHTSRHHYPGGEDRYWWLDKGKYTLYNPEIHH